MNWIILSLLAAFLWSVVNIIDKHVISKHKLEPIIPLFILNIIGLFIGIIFLFFIEIQITPVLLLGSLSGLLLPSITFLYFKAIKLEEISKVVPWYSLEVILVVIFGTIFLKEILAWQQYFGITIILIGLFLISLKKGFKLRPGKWMLFMILSALLFACTTILEKYILFNVKPLVLFTVIQLSAFIGVIPYLIIYRSKIINIFKIHKPKILIAVSLNETINIGAGLIFILALSLNFVSLVSILASIQYLFLLVLATLLSIFFPKIIKEELNNSIISLKLIAIILIIFGTYLII